MNRRQVVRGAGKTFAFAGCAAAGLTGCATAPAPVDAARGFSLRRVAIAAGFDTGLVLSFRGFTVFNNEVEKVDTGWDLGAHAMAVFDQSLAPRFEVVRAPLDPTALWKSQKGGGLFDAPRPTLPELARQVLDPGQVDAVILVASTSLKGRRHPRIELAQPLQSMEVHGYVNRNGVTSSMYLAYQVTVLDGRTFTQIGMAFGGEAAPPGTTYAGSFPITRLIPPHDMLDIHWKGEPWATMPAEQRTRVKQSALKLLDRSLPYTLQQAGVFGPVA